jgi:hypothetical protein
MKNLLNTLFKKEFSRPLDLTPTGIKSTIKSETHGTIEDYNETWKHINSQLRNFHKYELDYNMKIK